MRLRNREVLIRRLWGSTKAGESHNGVLYVNTAAAIALAGGQAIPLDYFHVFAFDAQTGKQLWESKPGFSFRDEVIDGGKSILVETVVQKEYSLQALDAKTGALRWQIALGVLACDIPGPGSPQIGASESHLYVLTRKRPYTLQVFDAQTGKALGHHPIAIPVKEGLEQNCCLLHRERSKQQEG
jgi:outer membrane protein assembly factor BamB